MERCKGIRFSATDPNRTVANTAQASDVYAMRDPGPMSVAWSVSEQLTGPRNRRAQEQRR